MTATAPYAQRRTDNSHLNDACDQYDQALATDDFQMNAIYANFAQTSALIAIAAELNRLNGRLDGLTTPLGEGPADLPFVAAGQALRVLAHSALAGR
jgi:hypothetical protein